ncbi:MAG: hypothetical protein IJY04_00490, partial [Clostridia bacterium]|nr:hypothetical protein [Clostridia bacterium]
DKVIAVVQFLTDNFVYTLDPRLPSSVTGYDSFLRETREGYCVQFATTAALILRAMGVPTRYVEGFVASDFREQEKDGEKTGMYACEVTDRQAHAWIEVYYEGYGWMPYETTKEYLRSYYGSVIDTGGSSDSIGTPGASTGDGDNHAPGMDEPITPPDDLPMEPVAEPFPTGTVVGVILVIVAVGALGYFIYTKLRDRAEAILLERRQKITDAINGTVSEEDFEIYAKEINAQVFDMFSLGGCRPNVGELPQEYAKRMEAESLFGRKMPFSEIMTMIQKQEFGSGVTKEELSAIAEYLDGLWKDVYRSKSRTQQFWYRYIRCVI